MKKNKHVNNTILDIAKENKVMEESVSVSGGVQRATLIRIWRSEVRIEMWLREGTTGKYGSIFQVERIAGAKHRKELGKVEEQKESQCDYSVVYEGNEKWKNNSWKSQAGVNH